MKYVDPCHISNHASSMNDISITEGSYESTQDSGLSRDQNGQSPTSVPNADHACGATQAQVYRSFLRSEDTSINEHFKITSSLSSIFVGRQGLLRELVEFFTSKSESQKRVIISGMGGIGKTQLAARVACELRENFYGVFWIDASSYELIRAGWARIARILGLEPNHRAGMHYFAGLREPWLLIMDNVEEPNVFVEDFLPPNDLGCVLLTTRYPAITVGLPWKSYDLTGLSEREGAELILIASGRKKPYSPADIKTASQIAASLDYLPLALHQAGKSVAEGLCELESYLELYRASYKNSQYSRTSYTATLIDETFRIATQGMDEDTLQILKLIPYFHAENIPIELFLGTLRKYHSLSEGHTKIWDDEWTDASLPVTSPIIPNQLRSTVDRLLRSPTWRRISRTPAIMPDLLKSTDSSTSEAMNRIEHALTNLQRRGFVRWHSRRTAFSVHRVLQEYVRRRVLNLGEEAVNCESAMEIMANCILLCCLSFDISSSASF